MCGIFGWCHDGTVDHTALAVTAAVLSIENDKRGGHSWGVSDGRNIYRGTGEMSMSRRATKLAKWPLLMGHSRFATTGAVVARNSHPFQIGPVLGMHNGIVTNHNWLNREYGRHCEVDSQHIFHHIAEKRDLADLEAYGAVAYVDRREPGRVFLGRFNGGDLAIYRVRRGAGVQAVVWSSTETALERALTLAGLIDRAVPVRVDEGTLYAVAENEVWKVDTSLADIDWYAGTTWRYTGATGTKTDKGTGTTYTVDGKSVTISAASLRVEPDDDDFCKACGDPLGIGEFGELCASCERLVALYESGDQEALEELMVRDAERSDKLADRDGVDVTGGSLVAVEALREQMRAALDTGPQRAALPAPTEPIDDPEPETEGAVA